MILGAAPLLGMKATDSTEFCISCHSMTHLWEVTKTSRHFQNDRGVQVGCPSCHVPHPIADYLRVKMLALHDVYSEVVNPVRTKESYEARRPQLAQKVRTDYVANDSAQCRNCHAYKNLPERSSLMTGPRNPGRPASNVTTTWCMGKSLGRRWKKTARNRAPGRTSTEPLFRSRGPWLPSDRKET